MKMNTFIIKYKIENRICQYDIFILTSDNKLWQYDNNKTHIIIYRGLLNFNLDDMNLYIFRFNYFTAGMKIIDGILNIVNLRNNMANAGLFADDADIRNNKTIEGWR